MPRVDVVTGARERLETSVVKGSLLFPPEGQVTSGALAVRGTPAALRLLAAKCEEAATAAEQNANPHAHGRT